MKKTTMVSKDEIFSFETNLDIRIIDKKPFSICTPALGGWSGYQVTYEENRFFKYAYLEFYIAFIFVLFFILFMIFAKNQTNKTEIIYENQKMYVWKYGKEKWTSEKLFDYRESFQRMNN